MITVYGPDGVSNVMLAATDAVAEFNSSQAGGTLPANMRFGRIDYAAQTVLPTLWWLWRFVVHTRIRLRFPESHERTL